MDFLCLALIQYRRKEFLQCEQMQDGLRVLQDIPEIKDPGRVLEVSRRIKLVYEDIRAR